MSNVDVNAAPSKQAKVLGRQIFQSFLLAGERNLNAGMSRAGTAEADFAELFQGVGGEEQTVLRGYFKKQMALSQLQRTGILGDLVKIKITTPLTLSRIDLAGLNAVRLTAPKIANGNRNKPKRAGRLDMVLRSIKNSRFARWWII